MYSTNHAGFEVQLDLVRPQKVAGMKHIDLLMQVNRKNVQ